MFEREQRLLSFVPRWSIIRQIRGQSVAEHSYYVALYVEQICRILDCDMRFTLDCLQAALWHDMEECFTGDIPGPSKRQMVDKRQVDRFVENSIIERFASSTEVWRMHSHPSVKAVLKVADLLDEVCYLSTEIQMGNHTLKVVRRNSYNRLMMAVDAIPSRVNINNPNGFEELKQAAEEAAMVHLAYEDRIPINDGDLAPQGETIQSADRSAEPERREAGVGTRTGDGSGQDSGGTSRSIHTISSEGN